MSARSGEELSPPFIVVSIDGHETSLLLHDGHRLDFREKLRPEQPGYLDGGTGWWMLEIDVLSRTSLNSGKWEIQEIAVQFNDVAEGPACGFNSRLEIFEHLLHLRAELIFTDDIPRRVQRNLTRDKDDLPTADRGDLGVADGHGHGFRKEHPSDESRGARSESSDRP